MQGGEEQHTHDGGSRESLRSGEGEGDEGGEETRCRALTAWRRRRRMREGGGRRPPPKSQVLAAAAELGSAGCGRGGAGARAAGRDNPAVIIHAHYGRVHAGRHAGPGGHPAGAQNSAAAPSRASSATTAPEPRAAAPAAGAGAGAGVSDLAASRSGGMGLRGVAAPVCVGMGQATHMRRSLHAAQAARRCDGRTVALLHSPGLGSAAGSGAGPSAGGSTGASGAGAPVGASTGSTGGGFTTGGFSAGGGEGGVGGAGGGLQQGVGGRGKACVRRQGGGPWGAGAGAGHGVRGGWRWWAGGGLAQVRLPWRAHTAPSAQPAVVQHTGGRPAAPWQDRPPSKLTWGGWGEGARQTQSQG